jgi:hypothetical protein
MIQLKNAGVESVILYNINSLNRLVSYKNNTLSFHFWLWEKLHNYFKDRKTISLLKKADAVVICDCIPNAFWKRLYNVERLKGITKKPVLLYEVFYLGNAPTQIEALKKNNDPFLERYNAHLFISPVTEIREGNTPNSYCIGLMANAWNLQPLQKKELIALVDFAQTGYETYRQAQIEQLNKAGIRFISLERRYSIDEIRDIYRQVSIYFMQSYEAFGLPILECLCTGAQIFTPHSGWPMSWRLDEDPKVHSAGILPGCFTVYNGEDDLYKKLQAFKNNFSAAETPLRVFDIFKKHYPAFYEGNEQELKRCIDYIKSRAV